MLATIQSGFPLISSPAVNADGKEINKKLIAVRTVVTIAIATIAAAALFTGAGALAAAIGVPTVAVAIGGAVVIASVALSILTIDFIKARNAIVIVRPEGTIGKNEWLRLTGVDVGDEPRLPRNPELKEGERLVLVPATLNGKPFSREEMGRIFYEAAKGWLPDLDPSGYHYQGPQTRRVSETQRRSYWTVIHHRSPEILYGTTQKCSKLNAAIVQVFLSVLNDKSLTGKEGWIKTEKKNMNANILVGGFSPGGLCIALSGAENFADAPAADNPWYNPRYGRPKNT